ncbi:Alpha-related fimbriae major subunit [Edwardsiella anguillarum]|uniref:hypothetical protein n=2 Tax=Edwardsiella TaxID=635 RepID=UPI00045C3F1D|nr:hypothetical protein [Edwardsiella anguillarum]GAJ67289.1 hypothetical protein MA13_contig00005-0069 [Edwardsiella piscicida]BET81769.1 Alpha-related fimbriae major subunit [Edwardsiella anguillarum]BET85198.1 Alpha-related fimbriae major subunit [Edwardsiella anguillarum]BET88561.1 Alpha-related fimbriae major subunit [Edwardsiella anguillarum]BET91852.1 Alpha-related fimbriae major subunit [Edwardsiella anguillarum]
MYNVIRGRFLRYLAYSVLPLSLIANGYAIGVSLNIFNQEVQIVSGDGPEILSDGVLQLQDNYPELSGFLISDLGNGEGDSSFHRRTSLFTVTLTGARYGRTITLRAKLGRNIFRQDSFLLAHFSGSTVNNGCSGGLQPDYDNFPGGAGHFIFIDSGNHDFTQDCSGNTYPFIYKNIRPIYTYGDARRVWLDIPTLIASDAWQSLPADTYTGSVSLNLESLENPNRGARKQLNTTTSVTIRKQPYFSGLSLPSTNVLFKTRYTQEHVEGYASTPLILQGSFDPNFGRVRLSVRSDNNFSLRNDTGRVLPYQAILHAGSKQYALNKDTVSIAPPVEIISLNSTNQLPLILMFQFNQDKSNLIDGIYHDNVTLIAELPLL